jgi:transposase-like protein
VAKRKFSEEEILNVVKQLEAGRTAAEMARAIGVSTSRLKRLVADLSLDREMLKALLIKTD